MCFFFKKGFFGVCKCFMFCRTLRYVHSSFVIILLGKRELVALLSLSSWCLVIVEWLSFVVPWVCLQFVIVVLPDHTHYYFYLLFIDTPIVGVCNWSMFCCTLRYVHSSFAIILTGKRELVALLSLSSWCLVIVVWLFVVVPCICLQFVISYSLIFL